MTTIPIEELRELCHKALTKTGLNPDHIRIVVDHYLENESSGKKSHGMVRVVEAIKIIGQQGLPQKEPEITLDQGNIAIIEGHMNLGPVIGKMVTAEAIKRAREHGICFVGGKHYMANSGSMAYYLRLLARENLIGLMSCNSSPMVAAPGGKERLVGTNPIGLGVPSDDGAHFIADFATSAIAYGKIMVAVDQEQALPQGKIIDKDGYPSTNPNDAKKDGAILPLADYRGFALALFVELLAASFGAKVTDKNWYGEDGIFIIAIDPSKLGTRSYTSKVAAILQHIRMSAPAPGSDSVSIPGDRSAEISNKSFLDGTLEIANNTLLKLKELAA